MTDHFPEARTKIRQTPVYDTMFEAISILQAVYLAMDSNDIPENLWGNSYVKQDALNVAIKKLIGVLPDIENI